MKKKSLKKLSFDKLTISKLTNPGSIIGGAEIDPTFSQRPEGCPASESWDSPDCTITLDTK